MNVVQLPQANVPLVKIDGRPTIEGHLMLLSIAEAAAEHELQGHRRTSDFTARWICETDNRWIMSSGFYTETQTQDAGTGAEPLPQWSAMGIYLRKDDLVRGFTMSVRSNSEEVTGYDMRWVFHHASDPADYAADPATPWASVGQTTASAVYSADNAPVGLGWHRLDAEGVDFTAPEAGHLVLFMRPVGVLMDQRLIYTTGIVEIRSAP